MIFQYSNKATSTISWETDTEKLHVHIVALVEHSDHIRVKSKGGEGDEGV